MSLNLDLSLGLIESIAILAFTGISIVVILALAATCIIGIILLVHNMTFD